MNDKASIILKDIVDPVFGNCKYISNGVIELAVTMDFGPRIISLSCCGRDNILYQDTSKSPLGDPIELYGGDILRLYGGHRLWISPEVLPRCYHPDNAPVTCTPIEGGLRFTAQQERHTAIQKSIDVTITGGNELTIGHSIVNCGLWDISLAPWAITMLSPGGLAIMPAPQTPAGLLPNRKLVYWEYADINDTRFNAGRGYFTLRQDKAAPFKVGMLSREGWAAYLNRGQIFIKQFDAPCGDYPDFGCNFEAYTNEEFLELETLGAIQTIAPTQAMTHTERWKISLEDATPTTDDEVHNVVKGHGF